MTTFHIYCDESGHLEHDGQKAEVIGTIGCSAERRWGVGVALHDLRIHHGVKPTLEVKSTRICPAKPQAPTPDSSDRMVMNATDAS